MLHVYVHEKEADLAAKRIGSSPPRKYSHSQPKDAKVVLLRDA